MNRLALIVATGIMALALTACGEQGGSKTPAGTNLQNTTQPTPTQPAGGNPTPTQNQ